jgi:glycoprotein 6-alpha-L-fucosyltransferase
MTENDASEKWRNSEAATLSQIIQQRLKKLQNPTDCQSAKKIHCTNNPSGCGIGKFR